MALVLMVALLPLVVATAVVQRGVPGLRMDDEVDPNELIGLTPDQVLVVPEAHPLHGSTVFTWRNTVLGAVTSAALLVTSVVAYLSMWALGIGPVGSLLAQGVIAERDPVTLRSFQNRTDDSSLASLITDAFDIELSRSWVVSLVDPGQGTGRLIVTGDVSRAGSGYLVTSTLAMSAGPVVARFEEASSGDDDLLIAIERLAERVRERLGESLRTIREGERLAPITTASRDALRLYRQAGRASDGGEMGEAMELLGQAVGFDPTFAMAWRRLGVVAEQVGDSEAARAAYQRVVDIWAPADVAARTVEQMRERIAALE
jgi:hypothetical protein